jgi:hypothetical protein
MPAPELCRQSTGADERVRVGDAGERFAHHSAGESRRDLHSAGVYASAQTVPFLSVEIVACQIDAARSAPGLYGDRLPASKAEQPAGDLRPDHEFWLRGRENLGGTARLPS